MVKHRNSQNLFGRFKCAPFSFLAVSVSLASPRRPCLAALTGGGGREERPASPAHGVRLGPGPGPEATCKTPLCPFLCRQPRPRGQLLPGFPSGKEVNGSLSKAFFSARSKSQEANRRAHVSFLNQNMLVTEALCAPFSTGDRSCQWAQPGHPTEPLASGLWAPQGVLAVAPVEDRPGLGPSGCSAS